MSELLERLDRWLDLVKQALLKDDPRFGDALDQTDWQGNAYRDSPFEQLADAIRAVLEDIKAKSKVPRKTVWLLDFIHLTNEEREYLVGKYEQLQNSVRVEIIRGMEAPKALLKITTKMLAKRK